jgi:hypothetical protein
MQRMWHEKEYLIINGYIQEKQIIFQLFYDRTRPFIYRKLYVKGLLLCSVGKSNIISLKVAQIIKCWKFRVYNDL